jgi:hypothetical protein
VQGTDTVTVQGTDTVTHSSVQSECPQLEMTAHLFNYNSNPAQQYVPSVGETSLRFEDKQCVISCAEREHNCQPLQKSSVDHDVNNVQQLCLRDQCVLTGSEKKTGDNRNGALLSRKNMQQDLLAGNAVNGNCVHERAERYTEFAVGIAAGSNVGNCAGTPSIGNQNTNVAHNMECMGDVEMNEVESLASEIHPASEVDIVDSPDKLSTLTQAHLRDSGMSNYQEAETLVFSDNSSDASTIISNSQYCVSRSVLAGCERYCADQDCGSSDSTAVECTGENEDLECDSAERHSSNIGCKQKFASG